MHRFMLKIAVGLAVVAASIGVLGTASVPAAKADGGINLCIGCTASSTTTSQGSVPICIDSANCATWFYYGGYLVWGPQTLFAGNTTIKRYYVYSSNGVFKGIESYFFFEGIIYTGQSWTPSP